MLFRLVSKKKEAKNITSFFFEPEKKFDYLPGQFIYLTMPKLTGPDPRGATREFSLSSSPTEGKRVRITTKFSNQLSGFKKTLKNLKIGERVDGDGPHGIYTWGENKGENHVFLAGGMGVTPFRSRVKFNFDENIREKILLVYSARSGEFVFENEFDTWREKNPSFSWKKVIGRITKKDIPKVTNYWLCGPPAMVDSMEQILLSLKVNPDRVFTEKFTGY